MSTSIPTGKAPRRLGEATSEPAWVRRLLIAVAPERADALVAELQRREAQAAAVIGRVTERQGEVVLILT